MSHERCTLSPSIQVISVNRPLDYEKIPNGMIYLTVMAKDGGTPPLNSTVPVTLEVIVSNATTDGSRHGTNCCTNQKVFIYS